MRKTCRCGVTFISARCHQLYADHTWSCPEHADVRQQMGLK